jgi:putative SOS response-associated peptidase YedK
MCGRFTLALTPDLFEHAFGCAPPEGLRPRYNITPDAPVVVVRAGNDGGREAAFVRWGLLGPWMKTANDPGRQINARAETAAEKPLFRDALKRGRCLIPATGFYEWQKAGQGPARPFVIAPASGEPFAFAGLWRRSRLAEEGELETCAILTTAAVPALAAIHPRMPVILPESRHALWLDPAVTDRELLTALLTAPPEGELSAHEVSRAVNNPRNDGPALLDPVDQGPPAPKPPTQGRLL